MKGTIKKVIARARRHRRVRRKVTGTPECPRLNVFRSNRHIYAQIVDDQAGASLVSASSLDADARKEATDGLNIEMAKRVGKLLAARAIEARVRRVVFDRGGYLFHGRVKALADSAREGGLEF